MKKISRSKQFNKICGISSRIVKEMEPPPSFRDHALKVRISGYRELKVGGDLLLLYRHRIEKEKLSICSVQSIRTPATVCTRTPEGLRIFSMPSQDRCPNIYQLAGTFRIDSPLISMRLAGDFIHTTLNRK